MSRPSDRRGFTLVELLVVMVVGALVVAATYQVLATNQRTYTVQNAQIRSQQSLRAGLEVLSGELREISTGGADIEAMSATSVTVRVMRTFGTACGVTYLPVAGALPVLSVRPAGRWFAEDDSVFVFADNDPQTPADDVWVRGLIAAVDTLVACPQGGVGQTITFTGLSSVSDTIREGAPLRSFVRYTYALADYDGQPYLTRQAPGFSRQPLVGPLRAGASPAGLRFEYLDALGAATVAPTDVAQIRLTLRTLSDVRGPGGRNLADSIQARIYARN